MLRRLRRASVLGAVVATAIAVTPGLAAGTSARGKTARAHASTVAPGTGSPTNGAGLYAKTIADALGERSFHEVALVHSQGYTSIGTESAVIGAGTETVRITTSSSLFGFSGVLTHDHLYLNGDQLTLVDLVGLSTFTGGFDAGRWLLVPKTSKVYEELAYGLDLKSGVAQIELGGSLTLGAQTYVEGERVLPISSDEGLHASATNGPEKGKYVLYVTVGKHPLPVEEAIQDVDGTTAQTVTLSFSRWGAATKISRPTPVIPLPT
jgi:hypothetical protein